MTPQDVRHLFSEHALRCTRQRLELYRTLASCKSHPTAEQLHRMVNENDAEAAMSLATAYNALEALCRAGLCRKIATTDGVARYDADCSDHMHVILDDGRVLDVPENLGQEVLEGISSRALSGIEQQMGVRITGLTLHVVASSAENA